MHRLIWKKRGVTPLSALRAYQTTHPELAGAKSCYAGRLDPMADGLLLVLFGEACRHKDRYSGLDKEYKIEVLLGASTDTGDLLGLPILTSAVPTLPSHEELRTALESVLGTHTVPYPAYSSKTVDGTPLFLHTLKGTLPAASIPTHEETVYRIRLCGIRSETAPSLLRDARTRFAELERTDEPSKELGRNFRVEEVERAWERALGGSSTQFPILTLSVSCGSGTYMRTLADRLTKALGTRGLARSIRRTRIGRRVSTPLGALWLPPPGEL